MKQKTIKIKGMPYKVIYTDALNDASGITKLNAKTILIKEEPDEEEVKKTLIHELAHAYLYESGLIEYSRDETLVYWLEHNLTNILANAYDLFNIFVPNKVVANDKKTKNNRK